MNATQPAHIRHPGSDVPFPYIHVRELLGIFKTLRASNMSVTFAWSDTVFTPFEKLEYLSNMTLDFLFEHYAVSKISILTDMQSPKEGDNTYRTYEAYLPIVAACRPDLDEAAIKRKTLYLITVMQQMFLRYEIISQILGIDLRQKENRKNFHTQVLHDILEV